MKQLLRYDISSLFLSLSLYDDIDGHIGFSFVSSSTFSSSLFSIFNNNHNHHHHIIVIIANIIYIYILLNFYFDKLFSFFSLCLSFWKKCEYYRALVCCVGWSKFIGRAIIIIFEDCSVVVDRVFLSLYIHIGGFSIHLGLDQLERTKNWKKGRF